MISAPFLLLLALLAPPPLTEADHLILTEAVDDGEAFRSDAGLDLLLRDAASWTPETQSADAFPTQQALAAPADVRGQAFTLTGLIRQSLDRPLDYDSTRLWTVMLEGEQPAVLFVQLPTPTQDAETDIGRSVTLPVRFYKTAVCEWIVDGSGQPQTVPILVGALPTLTDPPPSDDGASLLPIVIGNVVILFVIMLAARRASRRRAPASVRPARSEAPPPADTRPLPEDAAEALAELRRRGGRAP